LVFTGFQTNKYDIWCGIFSSHLLVNHNAIFRPWGVTAIWGIRGDKATDSHPLLQPAAAGEKLMRNSDSAAVHLLSTPIAIVLNNLLSLLLGERTLKSGPTNRR